MKWAPDVSVVLTTYNRETLLPRAVQSVLAQSWPSWELLVEDDGSTDGTAALLLQYGAQDARIRPSHHANLGPARSRNRGIARAQGAFLTFLDSDDAFEPEHLRLRIEYLRRHDDIAMLHGGVRVIGTPEQLLVPDANNPGNLVPVDECIIGGTFFARKGVIESAGGWDAGYAEDVRLYQRVCARYRVREVPFPTYLYYRDSADSRCDAYGRLAAPRSGARPAGKIH